MRTSLKVILAATAVATLASPVMAQSESHRHAASEISKARGSVARTRTAPVIQRNQMQLDDAVHVPFPQQSGGES
jgi:hypothetical protein